MYYIGIDIGGTFTDMVLVNGHSEVRMYKAPSTPGELSRGVLDAIGLAAQDLGIGVEQLLGETSRLAHGTTAATNALIERKGVKTGLITTKGFGDTLFIQRSMGHWAGMGENVTRFSMRQNPSPIVPKELVREVTERVDYKGAVVVRLDETEARLAARELIDRGVEAVAVCFLWSFRNPSHEQRVSQILREEAPDLFVTLSSDLVPIINEYERTATTAINCYLGPIISSYITDLSRQLRERGFRGSFMIMDSNGGVLPADEAANQAVSLLTSGPVGGVFASLQLANSMGYKNVITTDMGGTSFDVSLIIDGRPLIAATSEVSKYHIIMPMVNIKAIGSGGGSIAYVEDGHLYVGPQSAGAHPGPSCYGLGGIRPTVTDADVVLGIIDPDYFLGGRIKLDRANAEEAIRVHVAEPLGLSVTEAAAGIRTIVDNRMADLLRTMTVEKGYDSRDFVLFAYGGGGATHASVFGVEANVQAIVVPRTAPVHSAFGAVATDLHRTSNLSDLMRTPPFFEVASQHLDPVRIEQRFKQLEARCREGLARSGVETESIIFYRSLDMRYRRQVNELIVQAGPRTIDATSVDALVDRFEKKYEELYGKGAAFREAGIEITTFRVDAVAPVVKPALRRYESNGSDTVSALVGERRVYFNEVGDYATTRVYMAERLSAGAVIEGPAIIEHPGTTIVIGPTQRGRIDEFLNTIIEIE